MPETWFTSDTHFGHENVLSHQAATRPFASINEHDEALIEHWNAVVGRNDKIYHLGDFSLCTERRAQRIFRRLRGNKIVVKGNHDEPYVDRLGWGAPVTHYREIVFDGTRIALCHYALRVWPADRRGAVHLYGHSHGRLPGNDQSLDVGVDCWGLRPASWPEIRERLALLPPRFPPEHDVSVEASALHP